MYQRETKKNPYAIKKKLEAVLKHKHLEAVSKHKYKSMQKKGSIVQAKEKIEIIQPQIVYTYLNQLEKWGERES